MILNEEIWKCSMDMSTNLLTIFGRSKSPDDRNLGHGLDSGRVIVLRDLGIEACRNRLIVINAIEANAESLHQAADL